jgi:hypothetical protein
MTWNDAHRPDIDALRVTPDQVRRARPVSSFTWSKMTWRSVTLCDGLGDSVTYPLGPY